MSTSSERRRKRAAHRLSRAQRAVRTALLALLLFAAVGPTLPPSTENRTGRPIWLRPEFSARPIALPAASRFGGVDALADPRAHPGQIFRACDYCSLIVEADGRVKVLCSGLAASVCQVVRGGWKDRVWQQRQHTTYYDHDWDPLFARAGGFSAPRP